MTYEDLKQVDPKVYELNQKELERQRSHLEMIASENFVSKAVLQTASSYFTNKYAEGYPGRRYYGGCIYADEVEQLAIDRVKALFDADHANVQPHSGANANIGLYFAFLKPGDKILGMSLDDGGHLTHGSPVNLSGKVFDFISYGLDANDNIDYDQVRDVAKKEKPKMIVAGASAYPRTIDFKIFGDIAKETGALLLVDMAHIAGLVATGYHNSPIPYADFVTSTTHKTLRGPRGGLTLCKEEHRKKVDSGYFPGLQGGPLEHIIAAKAVAFGEAQKPEFKDYIGQVVKNAKVLAEGLLEGGIDLVSGGTDNHLLLLDLRSKNITGKEAETLLEEVGIATNKNSVKNDPNPPMITSGIRIGTPAVTTRGLKEDDMKEVADIIVNTLSGSPDIPALQKRIKTICEKYPLYQ